MPRTLRFGRFEFDPDTLDLRREGRPVRLQPQPARVLALLLQRPGRLWTRERLQDEVWPEEPSEITRDQGLNTCIRQIRDALGERAASPAYIETHHRLGYRFIAPVEAIEERSGAPAGSPRAAGRPTKRRFAWVAAAVAALTMAAAFVAGQLDGEGQLRAGDDTEHARSEPDPDARVPFLKGRHLLGLETPEGARRATPYLQEAVELDPDFALGQALLAEALFWTGNRSAAEDWARHALELAPEQPEAHVVLANILLDRDFDWEAARSHYERAIAAAPDRSEYHHAFAHYLTARGRHEEALERLALALDLDPLSPTVQGDEGWVQYWAGDYGTAAARCREAAKLMPASIRARAERCALQALRRLGRDSDARQHALRVMELAGADRAALSVVRRAPVGEALKAYFAWAVEPGNRTTALGRDSDYALARGYADLGRAEETLAALERALKTRPRGLATVGVEPRFADLRDHPRFQRVVAAIGLPSARSTGRTD